MAKKTDRECEDCTRRITAHTSFVFSRPSGGAGSFCRGGGNREEVSRDLKIQIEGTASALSNDKATNAPKHVKHLEKSYDKNVQD